jgi:hypothetical protein
MGMLCSSSFFATMHCWQYKLKFRATFYEDGQKKPVHTQQVGNVVKWYFIFKSW